MRISASLVGLLVLCGVSSQAADNLADPIVRISAAAWYQQPNVTIHPQGGGSVSGNSVGLDDAHTNIMVDAYVDVPVPLIPGIHAGVWQWKDATDNGQDVSANGGYVAALWELELIDRVGVALGGGALAQELDPGNGSRERSTVPAAAARAWVKFTDSLALEARLMAGGWSDDRIFDGVAQLNWRFMGPVALIGGWRQIDSEQKLDNGDKWDLTIGGPFLGASASF